MKLEYEINGEKVVIDVDASLQEFSRIALAISKMLMEKSNEDKETN